jgi:hypothetical protein
MSKLFKNTEAFIYLYDHLPRFVISTGLQTIRFSITVGKPFTALLAATNASSLLSALACKPSAFLVAG